MGEAWSDWYALDLLHREGLEIDDLGQAAARSTSASTRTRSSPRPGSARPTARRTRSAPCCPGGHQHRRSAATPSATSGKVFVGPEVHSDGEIWLQTLWDLRTQLLAGDRAASRSRSDLSEALVTEAMRLSPPEPSFLDKRNAILAADQGVNGGDLPGPDLARVRGPRDGLLRQRRRLQRRDPDRGLQRAAGSGRADGRGSSGTVTSADTGLPLEGITVGFGGPHRRTRPSRTRSSDTTDADGALLDRRRRWADTASCVFKGAAGFDQIIDREHATSIRARTRPTTSSMRRDWAASKAVGRTDRRAATTRAAPFGCGVAQVIDQSLGAGWSPFNPDSADPENPHAGPPTATITLPRPVDIAPLGMDPSNTCGDDPSATTKDYRDRDLDGRHQLPGREGGELRARGPGAAEHGRAGPRTTLAWSRSASRCSRRRAPSRATRAPTSSTSPRSRSSAGRRTRLPAGSAAGDASSSVALGRSRELDAPSFTDADSKITGYELGLRRRRHASTEHHGRPDDRAHLRARRTYFDGTVSGRRISAAGRRHGDDFAWR